MKSWSPPDIFMKRLTLDPERGSVEMLRKEAVQLADKEIQAEDASGCESMSTAIAWNQFIGAARRHWLCLELCAWSCVASLKFVN